MGEGGAVYTSDPQLARIVESLRDWGRDCWCKSGCDNTCQNRFGQQFGELPYGYDHKYVYSHFGYNLKITEMQAAIGCAQLEKLPSFIESRKGNWLKLREGLSGLSDKLVLPEASKNSDPSWFGFMMTIREGSRRTRDEVVKHLEKNNIQTRMLFAGNIMKHPCFDELKKRGEAYRVVGELKNTDAIMNRSFWVGVYPALDSERLSFIMEKTAELFI
jgi:CDP-4-dehydro-6-deoxyglucose reductase, E1